MLFVNVCEGRKEGSLEGGQGSRRVRWTGSLDAILLIGKSVGGGGEDGGEGGAKVGDLGWVMVSKIHLYFFL